MTRRKPIEWTEAHRREALRRLYELAATISGESPLRAMHIAASPAYDSETEARFRHAAVAPGVDVKREVRRVDSLASGRLVRDSFECLRYPGDPQRYALAAKTTGAIRVRVTRIRRSP